MDSEKHYTAKEIAEAWNLSQDTVQRIFLNEPGVLVITGPMKRYKRTKRTLRIPESVRFRVVLHGSQSTELFQFPINLPLSAPIPP
jgi:DNA-directed RNA polymerase specialized sigma subunit